MEQGGRKSFRLDELSPDYVIRPRNGILVPYLDNMQQDLEEREETA